jgi:hypothetical protein
LVAEKCVEHVKNILPPLNIHMVQLYDKLFDAHINLGQWEQALECGLMTIEPQRLVYDNGFENVMNDIERN